MSDQSAMRAERPLPLPGSEEFTALFPSVEHGVVYALLYNRRNDPEPPKMTEVRDAAAAAFGESHEQTDRRLRQLREWFVVKTERHGRNSHYRLTGWAPNPPGASRVISAKVRAQVFTEYGNRCAWCGRTPKEDQVKLVIDHKIPVAWGGTDDIENLQVLCEQDNHGKQAHFANYDGYAAQIQQAINEHEPQMRIGELLKAFNGEWVDVDLINLVAREENKGDPTRRLRELRALGWEIETRRKKEGKRLKTYYRVARSAPWPDGGARKALNAIEAANRKARERARSQSS